MEDNRANTPDKATARIKAFEANTVIIGTILALLSAVICIQIIGEVGVSANTSILGAIFAMMLGKLSFGKLRQFKNLERQNYIQTIVSAAGFSASNCAFIAIGIFLIMGEEKAIFPMAAGCLVGTGVSVVVVGLIYDSKIFPASNAWPPGVATADILVAGDEGGDKAKRVIQGVIAGIIGSFFKLPVGAVGIVFIASLPSMAALGIGLLIRGYAGKLFNFDIAATNIPQGFMIGAGVVALIQSIIIIVKSRSKNPSKAEESLISCTVSDKSAKRTIIISFGVHAAGAIILGIMAGIITDMSAGMFIAWVLWTAFSSVASMMLVGMAAMHSGWFPAFAITTIFMTFGVIAGFPVLATSLLTGYICSVGPCFADMGYDLKTGWLIRGKGADVAYELHGRKEQVKIELYGAILGVLVLLFSAKLMYSQGLVPPVSRVFVSTIEAGTNSSIVKELLIWAIPGVILQFAGGSKMLGVLFATGLLIDNPIYGIGVVIAVVIRLVVGDEFMNIRDAGLIAGDGLFGFFSALFKVFL